MSIILPIVAVAANCVTAAMLLCYRRGCSRYSFWKSLFAYAVIVCCGGQAIDIAFNGAPVTLWSAGLSVVIAVLAVRSRGNVMAMLRCA